MVYPNVTHRFLGIWSYILVHAASFYVEVTMATIGDVVDFCARKKHLNIKEKIKLLKETFPSVDCKADPKTLWSEISRLAGKKKKLRNNKRHKELAAFLNEPFRAKKQGTTPQSKWTPRKMKQWTPRKKKLAEKLKEARVANKHLRRKLFTAERWQNDLHCMKTELQTLIEEYASALQECDKFCEETEEQMKLMNNNHAELEKYIKEIETVFQSQSKKLQIATEKLSKWNARNFNKREKAKRQKISVCEEKLKQQDMLIEEMIAKIKGLEDTNKRLTKEKLSLQKKTSKLKAKLKIYSPEDIMRANTEKINNLEQEKSNLEEENIWLQDAVEAMQTLETQNDKVYTDQIREVVIDLLSKNVSVKHVSSVIKTILEKLAKVNITGPLPSETVIRRIAVEGRMLSILQAGKAMLEGNTTLHNDGSTQEKKKYNTTSVTTASGTLSLGLYEMAEENAQAVLEGNQQTVAEIAEILAKFDNTDPEMELTSLLSSITSTMSDRGSVMKSFNSEFQKWRSEKLQKVDGTSVEKLENFFCYMHVLINMASVALEALKCFDVCTIEKKAISTKNGRSTTEDSLYAACRTFQKQCDERTGQSAAFQAFLYGKNPAKKCRFSKLIGNRCNIQFVNGAAFYYHLDDMKEFLEVWKGSGSLSFSHNLLQQYLCNKVAVAGCRALGILEKLVTTPMWGVILSVNNILDLNSTSLTMRAEFVRLAEDASELLQPNPKTIFPGHEVADDAVYQALFRDSGDPELDALTISAMELIFSSWVILIEKQLNDYLPGGVYDNPDAKLKEKTKHVPTTNVTCERSIGYRNRLHQLKPSAKTLHIESLLLLSTNQTVDWLGKLSENDKKRALKTAKKAAPGCIKKQKEREQQILRHRLELLKQKQEDKDRKIRRVCLEKSKICEAVQKDGGEWKSPEEVEERLCGCGTESKQKEKILTQLRFHRVVLQDPVPTEKKYLLQQQVTVNGTVRKFSTSELKENLIELIRMNTLCHDNNNNNEDDDEECLHGEAGQSTTYKSIDNVSELVQVEKEKMKKKRNKQREKL